MSFSWPRIHERARDCMHGMRSGRGQGLIAFQIVRTYLDTQSSIEHDYLPSFLLGNHFTNNSKKHAIGKGNSVEKLGSHGCTPYSSGMNEDIRRICIQTIWNQVCYPVWVDPLRGHLTDKLPLEMESGDTECLACSVCNKSYVGETIRRLGNCIKEHRVA